MKQDLYLVVLGGLVVDVSLSVVCLLVDLVGDGITSGLCSGTDAGIAVLGNILVSLLGCGGACTLDGLRDVVCGLPGYC